MSAQPSAISSQFEARSDQQSAVSLQHEPLRPPRTSLITNNANMSNTTNTARSLLTVESTSLFPPLPFERFVSFVQFVFSLSVFAFLGVLRVSMLFRSAFITHPFASLTQARQDHQELPQSRITRICRMPLIPLAHCLQYNRQALSRRFHSSDSSHSCNS